jgi:hypothetical protein
MEEYKMIIKLILRVLAIPAILVLSAVCLLADIAGYICGIMRGCVLLCIVTLGIIAAAYSEWTQVIGFTILAASILAAVTAFTCLGNMLAYINYRLKRFVVYGKGGTYGNTR